MRLSFPTLQRGDVVLDALRTIFVPRSITQSVCQCICGRTFYRLR
ncbi:DUF1534 domain-containing protein [Pseudomonas sp. KBS0707]|nr:hypothetical protein DND36_20790 [Pseudomonas savastanoi pv. glycinea]QDW01590.1 DUF1534 domain-containing protein [Pseudomonas sp. KBS0707]